MRKKILAAVMAGMMLFSLAACGSSDEETTKAPETTKATEAAEDDTTEATEATEGDSTEAAGDLSGSISLSGSTSMEVVVTALQEAFMDANPDVTVNAEYVGSGAGIEAVTAKSVDIGNASRALTDEEKSAGVVENVIAIDGIAIVTDPANEASNLTKDQLIDIYTGEITNWSAVGGADMPIVVIGREAGSGTRGAFEEILEIEDMCAYSSELDSTGGVMARVAATPGAIGYVSLDVVDDTVKPLQLDGVDATEENIKAGTYILSRPFVMATNGEISAQSELVQAWFDFIGSEEGQQIITDAGLILPN